MQKAQAQAASCQASAASSGSTNLQPQVGGVALDQAATFLANMDDMTGAYYDATLDRIVFVGKKNTALPEFDKDDLATAIRAIFFKKTIPAVSIEPTINNGMMDVLYYGGIENTRFGKILFDADLDLKHYAGGFDASGNRISTSVSGYKSIIERYIDKNANPSGPFGFRFWISPKEVKAKIDTATNAFVFDTVSMKVDYESLVSNNAALDQAGQEFAINMTQNYDAYANETPNWKDAKQLAKIVGVVKWLGDNAIATDFHWAADYTPAYVATPKQIPAETVSQTYNNVQYTMSGGVSYALGNSYLNANGVASALKTASEAINAPKENIHWTFTKDGQQYESVAVAADAFRTLGSYNTTVNDMSFPTIGDLDLQFSRSYSSFSGGQNGIGRGWSFLPAQLVDNMPLGANVAVVACTTAPQNFFKRFALGFSHNGMRETFVYNNATGICKYASTEPFYHSEILVGRLNTTTTQYEITVKDQTKYLFEEYLQSNGIQPQPQSAYAFRLVAIKDHNGNKINYNYDTQNKLVSISDDKNHAITLSYNAQNLISQIADWTNRTVKYGYDAQGNLLNVTDSRNNITTYAYDTNNKLTTVTNREGQTVLTNSYTPEAKLATQTDAGNSTKAFTYNDASRTINIADNATPVRTVKVLYDQRARVLEDTDSLNNKILYTYGIEYAPLSIKDKNNNLTTNTYDSNGNVLSTTYPDGKKIMLTYNAQNRVKKITDERYSPTKITDFYYYEAGNVDGQPKDNLWAIQEAGKQTLFKYYPDGKVEGIWDALNHLTHWSYDDFGNKKVQVSPDNKSEYFYSDAVGRIYFHTDSSNKSIAFGYDTNNNLTTRWDAVGTSQEAITQYVYDKENRRKQTFLPNTAFTGYTYNTAGSIVAVADAIDNTTTYTYDTYQNLISKKDVLNRTTQYSYDQLNRMTQAVTPLGNTAKWEYDANGNLMKRIGEDDKVTSYEYNVFNRLTKTTYPDTTLVNRSYDNRNNLTQMVEASGSTNYTYDFFDRLIKAENSNGAVSYQYDLTNKLTKMTYPDGKNVLYGYDVDNTLLSITDWNNAVTGYEYYDNNLVKKKTLPNGIETSYTYDAHNRVTGITHAKGTAVLAKYTYERNSIGGITKVTEVDNFSPIIPPTTSTLLSAGKPIVASTQKGGFEANKANDGTINSYWEAQSNTYPSTLTIDLGAATSVNKVVMQVNWGGRTENVEILGSTDNTTFTTIVPAANYNLGIVPVTFTSVTVRYVRLKVNSNSAANSAQIAEFEVWGGGSNPTPTPTPTPTASGVELLGGTWNLAGSNGSSEKDKVIPSNSLSGMNSVQVTYNLHGKSFGNGDDEASVVFIQNGDWRAANVVGYGQNGLNASQTVTIPLTAFYKVGNAAVRLDPTQPVSNLHARFWNSSAFTVDVTSVKLVGATSTPTPTVTPTPTPAAGSWTVCANENQTCSFSGTKQVRYGANNAYFYKTATNSIGCNNATFGDPIPLTAKQCSYADTASPTPTPTPTPTPVPQSVPTATPTPVSGSAGTQLLPAPWNLVGNNGASEKYQSMSSTALQGMDTMRITYNLHGLQALGGDASAIIIDQGGWKFISLSNYGQNGLNGSQTVDIPLSAFSGLNVANPVDGTIHTRFWYGSSFTVDIISIVVLKKNTAGLMVPSRSLFQFISHLSIFQQVADIFTSKVAFAQTAGAQTVATFTYDLLGRLLSVVYPNTNYTYAYDPVGNRLTNKKNTVTNNYTYNTDNQLTQADTIAFTYDKKGNQIQAGQKIYSYNFDNKLTAYTDPTATTQYTYDGLGNRIAAKVGNTTTQFVNDVSGGLTNVLVAKNTASNISNFFVQGPEVISEGGTASENRKYYLTDGMGHIRFVTDVNGNHLQSISYDPYGNPLNTDSTSTYKFKGEQADQGGMVFMRARYYDPAIGRFISKDPVAGIVSDPRTQNGYDYALNDPVNLSDPSGLNPLAAGAACAYLACKDGDCTNEVKAVGTFWPAISNSPIVINGIKYTTEAVKRMEPVGLGGRGVPPSVVQNAIDYGIKTAGNVGNRVVSEYENVKVVTTEALDTVITVIKTGH